MKTRGQRRRFVFFASFGFVLACGMGAFAYYAIRPKVEPDGFRHWLGASEKASFGETLSPLSEHPQEDPLIAIPGLIVEEGSRNLTESAESTLFRAKVGPTRAEDVYSAIEAYWESKGLIGDHVKDMLIAVNKAGDQYIASWNHEFGAEGMVLLWRIRKINGGVASDHSAQQWPDEYKGIFPSIPAGINVMETGRPGFPGYCVMVNTGTDPETAFRSMIADMANRGWIPLHDGIKKSLAKELNGPPLDQYSMVYKHNSAPFGCQVLVRRDEHELQSSHVMLALF